MQLEYRRKLNESLRSCSSDYFLKGLLTKNFEIFKLIFWGYGYFCIGFMKKIISKYGVFSKNGFWELALFYMKPILNQWESTVFLKKKKKKWMHFQKFLWTLLLNFLQHVLGNDTDGVSADLTELWCCVNKHCVMLRGHVVQVA